MGAITQLDFTTSWEQSHSWILPRHGSNHTAGFYHVMGAITARFYHLVGAITQLDFTTSWEQSQDFTTSWEQSHS